MARLTLFRWVLGSLAVLALCAASAHAAPTVVQYNGKLGFGFGDHDLDAGDAGPDLANNAVPPCTIAPVHHIDTHPQSTSLHPGATTGSVNFGGLATINPTAPFPQAVKLLKQTRAPGATGLGSTGTAGHGGLTVPKCTIVQLGFGPAFTRRTQQATLRWPDLTATFSAGGGFGGPAATPFKFTPVVAAGVQKITVTSGAAKFGGSAKMVGIGDSILGINVAPVPGQTVFVGTLPVTFAVGAGAGPATPTLLITAGSPFFLQTVAPQPAGCVPISKAGGAACTVQPVTPGFNPTTAVPTAPPVNWFAFGANFPWTTGKVRATDMVGDFTTTRTRTGFDNRTAMGTHGTLSLVSANTLLISSVLTAVGLATTAEMTLSFVPEPAATTLLASGVLLLGGLYALRRRKR